MPSHKFERAAYAIVQHVKEMLARNLSHLPSWQRISQGDRDELRTVIHGSLDQGYHGAYDRLVKAYDEGVMERSGFTAIPDALLEVASEIIFRRGPKRRMAAFTIVRDDPYLQRWLDHYDWHLHPHVDIYVLDNDSADSNSVVAACSGRATYISLPSPSACDWAFITDVAKCFQKVLLMDYRCVLYSDADEFFVSTGPFTLSEYVDAFLASPESCAKATGWGIVQEADEGPLGSLSTRRSLWRAPRYDKTLLSKVTLDWSKGQHVLNTPVERTMGGLALLHARDADVDVFWQRCQLYRGLRNKSPSFQSASSREQVQEYFRSHVVGWADFAQQYTDERIAMPTKWRDQLL